MQNSLDQCSSCNLSCSDQRSCGSGNQPLHVMKSRWWRLRRLSDTSECDTAPPAKQSVCLAFCLDRLAATSPPTPVQICGKLQQSLTNGSCEEKNVVLWGSTLFVLTQPCRAATLSPEMKIEDPSQVIISDVNDTWVSPVASYCFIWLFICRINGWNVVLYSTSSATLHNRHVSNPPNSSNCFKPL